MNNRGPFSKPIAPLLLWTAVAAAGTTLSARVLDFTLTNASTNAWTLGQLEGSGTELPAGAWAFEGAWTPKGEALVPGPSLGLIAPGGTVRVRLRLSEGSPLPLLYVRSGTAAPDRWVPLSLASLSPEGGPGTFILNADGHVARPPATPVRTVSQTSGQGGSPALLERSPSEGSPLLVRPGGLPLRDSPAPPPPIHGLSSELMSVLEGRPCLVLHNRSARPWHLLQPRDASRKVSLLGPDGRLVPVKRCPRTVRMPDGTLGEILECPAIPVPPRQSILVAMEPGIHGAFLLASATGKARLVFQLFPGDRTDMRALDRRYACSISRIVQKNLEDWYTYTITGEDWGAPDPYGHRSFPVDPAPPASAAPAGGVPATPAAAAFQDLEAQLTTEAFLTLYNRTGETWVVEPVGETVGSALIFEPSEGDDSDEEDFLEWPEDGIAPVPQREMIMVTCGEAGTFALKDASGTTRALVDLTLDRATVRATGAAAGAVAPLRPVSGCSHSFIITPGPRTRWKAARASQPPADPLTLAPAVRPEPSGAPLPSPF